MIEVAWLGKSAFMPTVKCTRGIAGTLAGPAHHSSRRMDWYESVRALSNSRMSSMILISLLLASMGKDPRETLSHNFFTRTQ